MKASQREIYHALVDEIDWGICSFCKYQDYHGSACNSGYSGCIHPLSEEIGNECDCGMSGIDCWGFRPNMPIAWVADTVGVLLTLKRGTPAEYTRERDHVLVFSPKFDKEKANG